MMLPGYVTLDAVQRRVTAYGDASTLSKYGGHRLTTAAAVCDLAGWSDEYVWNDDDIDERLRDEFDDAQAKRAKCQRKLFEVRESPEGSEVAE